MTPERAAERVGALRANLQRVIRGKTESLDILFVALLSEGSVLLEDVPGVGKTTLAKALARSLDLSFQRIQFTPDLLPTDILGASIYNPVDGTFSFRKGPIFCNVLLADEINRASPRTQSALLEAMSERQATIEGRRYPLPEPFLVIATENPVEFHGTYPLPEAQLDRFQVQIKLGYPDFDTEVEILYDQQDHHPLEDLSPVLSREELLALQRAVRTVTVDRSVSEYLVRISRETRQDPRLALGVSPRGSLLLFRSAQAHALLDGRNYVLPDDVRAMATHVLSHRLVLTSQSRYAGVDKTEVIEEILHRVPVPV
ncbi:MAG: MoxR family ATPase [Planctomycetota bacterium]|nr:MAG: MoxR family ATPase [Planctomycetota bacterium]